MGSFIQKIFSSRVPGNANAYVGEMGRIFYDQNDPIMRLSDGITPGGIPFSSQNQQYEPINQQLPVPPDYGQGILAVNSGQLYWTTLDGGQF